MSTSSKSFFALIIGINEYQDPEMNLNFATSDATAIENFLTEKLDVPEENIVSLLNRHATHRTIVETFRSHLIENDDIKDGDPILFFYAGHGTRYLALEDWPTDDGECEAICPSDRRNWGEDEESNGVDGVDILDRKLGALFTELRDKKGDNITVIMDCCHSGSITRAANPVLSEVEGLRWRNAPPIRSKLAQSAMFSDTTHVMNSVPTPPTRSLHKITNVRDPDGTTHVLLSACRQDQRAAEWSLVKSGVFSHSLLKALESLDITRLTYASLRDALNFPTVLQELQIPQCEGRNKNRTLFNGKALGINTRLVPIGRNKDKKLRIEAGAVHGIVPGTLFTVRSTQFYSTGRDLGAVEATEVDAIWCLVKPVTLELPPGSYAMVASWANFEHPFTVGFGEQSTNPERQKVLEDRLNRLSQVGNIVERDDADVHMTRTNESEAAVVISIHEEDILLDRRDPLIVDADCPTQYNLPLGPSQQEWALLNNMSRFHFHLHRDNPAHPFVQHISVELKRLDYGPPSGDNLLKDGKAKLEHEVEYAMILHNNSEKDLWPALYYFDPSTYGIQYIYAAPSAQMQAPLRARSSFTIGYGGAGVNPLSFACADGEDHDAGFVKLFITSQFTDMMMIEQDAGFMYKEGNQKRAGMYDHNSGEWDTLLTVVDVAQSEEE